MDQRIARESGGRREDELTITRRRAEQQRENAEGDDVEQLRRDFLRPLSLSYAATAGASIMAS